MSGDRTKPRFDIVASTRRSWSRAQKLAMVAEVDVAGASVSQVARRHGVHASLLFRWRRDFRVKPDAPASGTDKGTAATTPPVPGTAPQFVPIMLPPPEAAAPAKPSPIEIVIAGGRTVRIGADIDTAALVRIIAALEAAR